VRNTLFALLVFAPLSALAQPYDVVFVGGRVIDPETNLDAMRHVGVTGGRIAAVSNAPLEGRTTIDARGLVVTAGFIDLHSHGQDAENYAFKARDGVTTALELEIGASPVAAWYSAREGRAVVNFGATSGHVPARMAIMGDVGRVFPTGPAANRVATPAERMQTLELVRRGLDEGGLGVGLGIQYTPSATPEEILELFELAAQRRVPVYVHLRSIGLVTPGAIDSLQEVLADAAATGAALHVVHVTSIGLRGTPVLLRMIDGARRRGLDVTTEAYPYTAGSTDLSSAFFSDGWQARSGIDYGEVQWAATGERLTAETFARYRPQGGRVIIHNIPEDVAQLAVADPTLMIASDGRFEDGVGHPRSAGTFARVLGHYVREQQLLTLMDALRKMSLMPAQRLGAQSKGRLQAGADADIVVFDPERVIDHATFEDPTQYSAGIPYVMVNGVFVVKEGELQAGVAPGRGLRR
jgi:dihydroorotase